MFNRLYETLILVVGNCCQCLPFQLASFVMMAIGTALGSVTLAGGRQISFQYAEAQNRKTDLDESVNLQETSAMLSMYQ